jgi:hypothetical protein
MKRSALWEGLAVALCALVGVYGLPTPLASAQERLAAPVLNPLTNPLAPPIGASATRELPVEGEGKGSDSLVLEPRLDFSDAGVHGPGSTSAVFGETGCQS